MKHSPDEATLKRRIRETERARNGFLALIVAWCVLALITTGRAEWEQGTFVKLKTENAPMQSELLLDAMRYSAWSWQQRTGIAIDVTGTTDRNTEEGGIVYRWEDQPHFEQMGLPSVNGYTRRWIYSGTDETYSYEVVLNLRSFNKLDTSNMRTITHEMGHALGALKHAEDSHSVMSVPVFYEPPRYALSTMDALEIGSTASLCHAELTREFDIYLPDIDGKRATLKYLGNQTWKLQTVSDNPVPPGCQSAQVDPETLTLFLNDVRNVDASYDAIFDYAGNDTWKLRWAQ